VLPTYSTIVQEGFATEKIHNDYYWRQLILESAFFYMGIIPNAEGAARVSYGNIGRTTYEKYPSISAKGHLP